MFVAYMTKINTYLQFLSCLEIFEIVSFELDNMNLMQERINFSLFVLLLRFMEQMMVI